jgi:hypothetical protein
VLTKKLFLSGLVIFVSLLFSTVNSVGTSWVLWSQTYGGEGSESANSLIVTSDGGYALAGYISAFGGGESDVWLIKVDEMGIPEFPSWTILPLLVATTIAVIICRNRFRKKFA